MTTNIEKKLQANVIDDTKYTKKQMANAYAGLWLGLWIPFVAALMLLVLCTRGVIG